VSVLVETRGHGSSLMVRACVRYSKLYASFDPGSNNYIHYTLDSKCFFAGARDCEMILGSSFVLVRGMLFSVNLLTG